MANPNSIWWERCAALCAAGALLLSLASANLSCGKEDLAFSGEFVTATVRRSPTPTETPDPGA